MLIKSVGVTFSILRAFVGRRSALTLKEIGFQSGLPASKAHRYLQSLIREGMISQDPRTRHYRLGPAAIDLGLEALENTDPVVQACEIVKDLPERFDVAIGVDVMGPGGPICIWYGQPITPFSTPARLGGSQGILDSAAGRIFLSFLPRHITRPHVRMECKMRVDDGLDPDTVAYRVKTDGYAVLAGRGGAACTSLAAPVLDARGEACAAISFYVREPDPEQVDDDILVTLLTAASDASAFRAMAGQLQFAEAV